ncbi:MAG: acyl-CoA dehydrogenase family protein [Pseudomonadota bacterium]
MDFAFTQEQEMLRESVARYLEKNYDFDARQDLVKSDEGWSEQVWNQFAELGLLALPFSEEKGGLGGSISDCVAFAQSFGKHLVVEPYAFAIALAGAAFEASDSPLADQWIEKLATGEAVAAFAYEEGKGSSTPDLIRMTATVDGDGYTLNGEKKLVIAGAQAEAIVVAARVGEEGSIGFFLVDQEADGLSLSSYKTIDGRSAANIRFNAVAVSGDAILTLDATEALEAMLAKAIIIQAAEAVGAIEALVKISSEYALTRKQFGQPIMMFQSIAHRLADMKIAYTKALSTLIYTTALATSGAAKPRDIAVLKAQIGKLGKEVGESAIQIHGGLGLTDELNVGHYHKRLLAFDAQLGDHTYHMRMIGQA